MTCLICWTVLAVCRLLLEHVEGMDDVRERADRVTLDHLGLAVCGVFTVSAEESALRAFDAMTRAGLSAAAVTRGDNGVVVANLSASDMRLVLPDRFGVLARPVADFLALGRARGARPCSLVYCHRSTSLRAALATLVRGGLHHAFVMEDGRDGSGEGDLIGIVTLTDILRAIVYEADINGPAHLQASSTRVA